VNFQHVFLSVAVKGPAADATDAPQPMMQPYDEDDDDDYYFLFFSQ
jgi:hypothetical protein